MRNISTFITGLAVIALTGCGGGGGGGSGGMAPPPPPGSASSLVAPGTFLAGPGGNFTDSADSETFSGNTVTSASNSASGAQVGLMTDASTGKTRFLSLNIPLGDGSTYSHTFDLAGAVAGSGPSAGLIAMQEGALGNGLFQNTLILDPSLTFSTYGIWLNEQQGGAAGATGAIAFGNMTPAAGIPTSGSATYSGKTLGTALNLAQGSASILTGTATFNANFTTMMITGNLNLNDVTNNVPFANLTMPATNIAAGSGGAYNGTLTGMLPDNNPVATSDVHGHFNGPTANETSGTWSAANSNWRALGAYGAKRQ
jgi:hypothetical protein